MNVSTGCGTSNTPTAMTIGHFVIVFAPAEIANAVMQVVWYQ